MVARSIMSALALGLLCHPVEAQNHHRAANPMFYNNPTNQGGMYSNSPTNPMFYNNPTNQGNLGTYTGGPMYYNSPTNQVNLDTGASTIFPNYQGSGYGTGFNNAPTGMNRSASRSVNTLPLATGAVSGFYNQPLGGFGVGSANGFQGYNYAQAYNNWQGQGNTYPGYGFNNGMATGNAFGGANFNNSLTPNSLNQNGLVGNTRNNPDASATLNGLTAKKASGSKNRTTAKKRSTRRK